MAGLGAAGAPHGGAGQAGGGTRDSPRPGHGAPPWGQDRTLAELQTGTAAGSLGQGLTDPGWAKMGSGAVGRGGRGSQVGLGRDSKIY